MLLSLSDGMGQPVWEKIVVLFFFFTQSWFPPTPTHTIPKEDRVNISGKKQSVKPQKASQI